MKSVVHKLITTGASATATFEPLDKRLLSFFEPSALSQTTSPYEHEEKHLETILGSEKLPLKTRRCRCWSWHVKYIENPMAAEQQHLLHLPMTNGTSEMAGIYHSFEQKRPANPHMRS